VADAQYHVEVHGSVGGNVVVGDHNLVVNAESGSSVSVVQEALRPNPVRRTPVRVLPRRPGAVLGRARELGAIAAAVVGRAPMQVYGRSGVGKSTLLRKAAHDLLDVTDGVVFLSASGRDHADVPQEVFEACYETYGYKPGPTDLSRLMSGVRVCVVADDLDCTPDELTAVMDAVPDASFVFSAEARERIAAAGDGSGLLTARTTTAARAMVRATSRRRTLAAPPPWPGPGQARHDVVRQVDPGYTQGESHRGGKAP
jgi:hypothetical protein